MKSMLHNYFLAWILFASFFFIHTAWGWTLPIKNETPYTAHIEVHYILCASDKRVVPPSQTQHINASGCLVSLITGVLDVGSEKLPIVTWKPVKAWGKRDFTASIRYNDTKKHGYIVSHR